MNFHLYLSSILAHLLGTHKGMIISMIGKLYKHYLEIKDYISEVHTFYLKLLNADLSPELLIKTFTEVEDRL